MEQLMVGAFGNGVRRGQSELGIGDDGGFGLELMTYPSDSDPLDLFDTLHPVQHPFDLVDQLGVHTVHQPTQDVPCGGAEHTEEGQRDEQAHDGVGPGEPDRHSYGAGDHGKRSQAIGAGVPPVGHQGG